MWRFTKPLLVPPLSFKFLMFPNLIELWNSARISIEQAKYLIVVGYSFSEADTYITKIISRSMSINSDQKMLIINTNPDLVTLLRERFSARIKDFDKNRILKSCKNSDESLPEILTSFVSTVEKKKVLKVKRKLTKKKIPK